MAPNPIQAIAEILCAHKDRQGHIRSGGSIPIVGVFLTDWALNNQPRLRRTARCG